MMLYRKDRKNWEKSLIELAKSNKQKNQKINSEKNPGRHMQQSSGAAGDESCEKKSKKKSKSTSSMFGSDVRTSRSESS
jgi:hypothetical protein